MIESKDVTIADVFQSFYVVPSYQREFVWQESQVEQLLKDIRMEQINGTGSEYFIGSIVVCPRQNDDAFDLIDGQQRTTAIFITFCAIRNRLIELNDMATASISKLISDITADSKGYDKHRTRLEPQYADAGDIFAKLRDGEVPAVTGTRSMQNVASAYAAAARFLEDEFDVDTQAIRSFYKYLIGDVKLIRIRTDSLARALKIFETINDRGVGLDAMDLLKNLLFIRASHNEFDALKTEWKALVDNLYIEKEKPLRFLRYYILATFGAYRPREDELYSWMTENEAQVGYGRDPLTFVARLRNSLSAYLNFLNGTGPDGKPHPTVQAISIVAGRSTRQHLILLLAGRALSAPIFDSLCRDVESLIVIYLVTRTNNREFESIFPEWALHLASIKTLDEYDAFAEVTIRQHCRRLAARFYREFIVLGKNGLRQFQMRYLLAKLTQYIDLLAYGQETEGCRWLSRYTDGSNINIEHILPQTPTQRVEQEFGEGANDLELLWNIGNLALVERAINIHLGNRPFSEKRPVYPKSQLLLTRAIAELPTIGNTAIDRAVAGMKPLSEWNRANVRQRAKWMAALAMKVWNVDEGHKAALSEIPSDGV